MNIYDELTITTRQLTPFCRFARRDAQFESRSASPGFPALPRFSPCVQETYGRLAGERAGARGDEDGDPYFVVAGNPLNPLYDQDYRANDVEGYRIYRGRTQSQLTLVAQYDYAGTYMTDYTAQFAGADYGVRCAPECCRCPPSGSKTATSPSTTDSPCATVDTVFRSVMATWPSQTAPSQGTPSMALK